MKRLPDAAGSRLAAIGLALTAFALFSVNDALMKLLSARYPLPQIIFFNALFAMMPVVAFGLWRDGLRGLSTRRLWAQIARGCLGASVGFSAFFALSRMPMAEVYAILFAAPLVIGALSAVIFKEKLDRRSWTAVIAGFGGVLLMLRPESDSFNVGALAALWAAVAFSLSALIVRHWGRDEPPASFPFYGCIVGLAVNGPLLPLVWVPVADADMTLIAATGVVAGTALCCMLNAFRLAPPPLTAPFQYSQMLWGVLFGALFFGDYPDAELLLGGGVVVAAGFYLFRRERRQSIEPSQSIDPK